MVFVQPSIELLGLRIDTPVTTITDLLICAVCYYSFYKLSKIPLKNKFHLYIKYYFLSMGTALLIGGIIGHGFLYLFDARWESPEAYTDILIKIVGENLLQEIANPWKLPGWLTSMFAIALIERSIIEYSRKILNRKVGIFFSYLNVIELLIFVTITFSTLNFFFVEVHSAYGLLIVVSSFSFFIYRKTKGEGVKLFLIAVSFSAVSALIFMNEWGLSIWFNHFDISHCLMAISAFMFFLGAKKIINDSEVEKAEEKIIVQ